MTEEERSPKRRRPSLFDVGPSPEAIALEAAVAAAKQTAAPALTVLERDRERAERALERNLEFVATAGSTNDDEEETSVVAKQRNKFVHASRAGIGAKKKFSSSEDPEKASVRVSGLPEGCGVDDLKEFFRGHGRVKDVTIKDDEALVTFAKAGSARQASQLLDGKEVREGFEVSVEMLSSLKDDEVGCLPAECRGREKPVVVLRHIFDPAQCALRPGRTFLDELEREIFAECSKYGQTLHVCALGDEEYQGSIAVTFDNVKVAELCCQDMAGRYFDQVQIIVERLGNWDDDDRCMLPPIPSELSERAAPRDCFTAVIRNAFTEDELERGGAQFIADLESEFRGECENEFGKVRGVSVEASVLVVAFETRSSLEKCLTDLDGRWFDLRKLKVDEYSHKSKKEEQLVSAFFEDVLFNTKT